MDYLSRICESIRCCCRCPVLTHPLPPPPSSLRPILSVWQRWYPLRGICWRDKSVCQRGFIIKLFQRSFNIAEEGLHSGPPRKIRLKHNLCVRDESWNETFKGEKMNCGAGRSRLVMADCVTLSAKCLHWCPGDAASYAPWLPFKY